MKGRPPVAAGSTFEPKLAKIERIDKRVDGTDRVVSPTQSSRHSGTKSTDPGPTSSIKRFIKAPAENREDNPSRLGVFTQPGPLAGETK